MASTQFLRPFQSSRELINRDPMLDLHRDMNRVFDEVFRGSLWPLSWAQQATSMMAPVRVDVEERDDELCVTADLPGVQQSDVEVKIEGETLTIAGEKKSSSEQKQNNFHLMERSYGRFERSMQLPFAPETERAQAEFENGVLTIHLPKEENQQRTRRIEIRGPSQSGNGNKQMETTKIEGSRSGSETSSEAESNQSASNRPTGSQSSQSSQPSAQSGQKDKDKGQTPDASRKQSQPA
jgi:HSP20 family protein